MHNAESKHPITKSSLRSLLRRSRAAGVVSLGLMVVLISLVLLQCPLYSKPTTPRPNIIFILADDLGYGDLGCYGQERIKTPWLDRMAGEGTRFSDCYAGCPLCAPSRCALMTGRHMGHAYIRANSASAQADIPLRAEDATVAELLRAAGYRTGLIGKWHLGGTESTGSPTRKGFDYAYGFPDDTDDDYFPRALWRNGAPVNVPPGAYSQDLFTEDAIAFIRGAGSTPFFLYLAYTIPHVPFEVPSDAPYEQQPWPDEMKARAAMITRMDHGIGALFKLLKELGIDQQTAVFFSSDNGPTNADFFQSSGPFSGGKRSLSEGGIRVPMIVRWPEHIPAGRLSGQAWAFWDFLPTACEIAGASAPADVDGVSVLPVLLGQEPAHERLLYWEYYPRKGGAFEQAARLGRWKAIRADAWRKKGKRWKVTTSFELFDLTTDPSEQVDLADEQLSLVADLQKAMSDAHTESTIWPSKPPGN
ncbi:MAG TPA: arylsulfatase [Blastocatellia bacterium]|nr:arylsulfatase [Blastocatellia bacterium]